MKLFALVGFIVFTTKLSASGHVCVDPQWAIVLNEKVRSLFVAVSVYGGANDVSTLWQVLHNLQIR